MLKWSLSLGVALQVICVMGLLGWSWLYQSFWWKRVLRWSQNSLLFSSGFSWSLLSSCSFIRISSARSVYSSCWMFVLSHICQCCQDWSPEFNCFFYLSNFLCLKKPRYQTLQSNMTWKWRPIRHKARYRFRLENFDFDLRLNYHLHANKTDWSPYLEGFMYP